jgi:tetraacyldisaccharide 4'-kinase
MLRALLGRRLERGVPGSLAGAASRAWAAWSARSLARPLRLPEEARVIGIGGAVLGGAGKTPVAIAIARALAERGERPALVSHAYRARPSRALVVQPHDRASLVGDDALASARALAGTSAAVIVAPRRQDALDHAAALGHRTIVIDGLLQASPRRLAASVLVLDARAPWGSGACPPAGDLRAPPSALLAAADLVAAVGDPPSPSLPAAAIRVPSSLAGALSASDARTSIADLARARTGLLLAVAHPERVVTALAGAGVHPLVTLCLGDHDVPSRRVLDRASLEPVDLWLTTARCATKLPAELGRAPVLALDHRVDVAALVARIA